MLPQPTRYRNAAYAVMAERKPASYQGIPGTVTSACSPGFHSVNFRSDDSYGPIFCLLDSRMPGLIIGDTAPAKTLTDGPDLLLGYLISRAMVAYPTAGARITRGAAIVSEQRLLLHADGSATAQAAAGDAAYTVTSQACTCPDASQRGVRCKHRWARCLARQLVTMARHTAYASRTWNDQGIVADYFQGDTRIKMVWISSDTPQGVVIDPLAVHVGGRIMLTGLQKAWASAVQ